MLDAIYTWDSSDARGPKLRHNRQHRAAMYPRMRSRERVKGS